LLVAGESLAQVVEHRASDWTIGALARLVHDRANGDTRNRSIPLSLFLTLLGVAAIVAYLFVR
jgi:hypothetical protein